MKLKCCCWRFIYCFKFLFNIISLYYIAVISHAQSPSYHIIIPHNHTTSYHINIKLHNETPYHTALQNVNLPSHTIWQYLIYLTIQYRRDWGRLRTEGRTKYPFQNTIYSMSSIVLRFSLLQIRDLLSLTVNVSHLFSLHALSCGTITVTMLRYYDRNWIPRILAALCVKYYIMELLNYTVLCHVLYCTVLYFTVLCCTVLNCTVLYCTVLCLSLWVSLNCIPIWHIL